LPYEWAIEPAKAPGRDPGAFSHEAGDEPFARLRAWPHRSLPIRGFAWVVGGTALLLALPLLGVLGTPILWGLLPFALLVLGALWWALMRSYGDGALTEELTLWRDRIELVRRNPNRPPQRWEADPYWVRVTLTPEGGPVANYLTLTGGGRAVELGAFLAPEERAALEGEVAGALARLR
jgi:uncharacterized membrane protein